MKKTGYVASALVLALDGVLQGTMHTLEAAVRTATGPAGLGIIAVYSFLIAAVLPLPSEVVLLPVTHLQLGLPHEVNLVLVILISGAAKAAGSVMAFHLGQKAKQSGPIISALRSSRIDVVAWSERKTVQLAQQYGYVGLALALCVPGFPDTLSIYAFTVLEEDHVLFGLATFVGSVGRLIVTLFLFGLGAVAIV